MVLTKPRQGGKETMYVKTQNHSDDNPACLITYPARHSHSRQWFSDCKSLKNTHRIQTT